MNLNEHLIILPTAPAIDNFKKNVQYMTNHDYDYGEIIKDVFEHLAYFPDIKDAVAKSCEIIVSNFDRAGARDDGIVLSNAIGTLTNDIFGIFTEIKAWDSSGLLGFHYCCDIDDDWVVKLNTYKGITQHDIDNKR